MDNFFKDTPDFKFHLEHPLVRKIVKLKERNFEEALKYDYAPQNHDDAIDNYEKILEIVGEICANTISANAESVDLEGPQWWWYIDNRDVSTGHHQEPRGVMTPCWAAGIPSLS